MANEETPMDFEKLMTGIYNEALEKQKKVIKTQTYLRLAAGFLFMFGLLPLGLWLGWNLFAPAGDFPEITYLNAFGFVVVIRAIMIAGTRLSKLKN